MKLKNNKIRNVLLFSSFILLILYRYLWSFTPSWFIDSVATLYISETYSLSEVKVGLVSSKYIPQPNGMIIFGYLLKNINNLIHISFFLSLLQLILFFLFIRELKISSRAQLMLFFLLSTSTLNSNFSVHFYNQWFVINFSILFFYFLLKFHNSKNLNYLPYLFITAVIPPTIYLASLVTSLFMLLTVLVLTFNNRDLVMKNLKNLKIHILSVIFFYLLLIVFIWIPYLSSVDFSLFNSISMSISERFSLLIKYITLSIPYLLSVFTEEKSLYIRFLDPTIISSDLQLLKIFYLEAHQSIINIFIIFILIAIKNKLFLSYKNFNFLIIAFFIMFYTVITPIAGGNKFLEFDRMDQYVEVYPFFLILIFLFFNNFDYSSIPKKNYRHNNYLKNFAIFSLSFFFLFYTTNFLQLADNYFVFSKPNLLSISTYIYFLFGFIFIFFEWFYYKYSAFLKTTLFIGFLLTNIGFSLFAINERLNPPYSEITEGEVSIYTKYKLINYLIPILEENKIKEPKISYQLGGQKFEWIDTHGALYSEWFQTNPYTLGRTFDYILLKEWGISNYYEGKQIRDIRDADFIINFSKDKVLIDENQYFNFYIFDQLQLSINKNIKQ